MYKCVECGNLFEEGEEVVWEESRGEFWGSPCSETLSGCPVCKGNYEETIPCKICGSHNFEDEFVDGVCEECISEYKTDFSKCYSLVKDEKQDFKINPIFISLLGDAIDEILAEYVKNEMPNIDCSEFVDEDKIWFVGKMLEVKKNEK